MQLFIPQWLGAFYDKVTGKRNGDPAIIDALADMAAADAEYGEGNTSLTATLDAEGILRGNGFLIQMQHIPQDNAYTIKVARTEAGMRDLVAQKVVMESESTGEWIEMPTFLTDENKQVIGRGTETVEAYHPKFIREYTPNIAKDVMEQHIEVDLLLQDIPFTRTEPTTGEKISGRPVDYTLVVTGNENTRPLLETMLEQIAQRFSSFVEPEHAQGAINPVTGQAIPPEEIKLERLTLMNHGNNAIGNIMADEARERREDKKRKAAYVDVGTQVTTAPAADTNQHTQATIPADTTPEIRTQVVTPPPTPVVPGTLAVAADETFSNKRNPLKELRAHADYRPIAITTGDDSFNRLLENRDIFVGRTNDLMETLPDLLEGGNNGKYVCKRSVMNKRMTDILSAAKHERALTETIVEYVEHNPECVSDPDERMGLMTDLSKALSLLEDIAEVASKAQAAIRAVPGDELITYNSREEANVFGQAAASNRLNSMSQSQGLRTHAGIG